MAIERAASPRFGEVGGAGPRAPSAGWYRGPPLRVPARDPSGPADGGRELSSASRGLTVIEMLIVLILVTAAALLTWPALLQQISHAKARGRAEEIGRHLLVARLEALKRGQAVVVRPDYLRQSLYSFVDTDDDLALDLGEGSVWVLTGATAGHADLLLMGPTGAPGSAADPAGSVDGLTTVGGGPERGAVFEPDGSIRDPGAFRIADRRDPRRNVFEIRVEPAATARIEVRKYVYDGPAGTGFYSSGGGSWEWY